MFLKLRQVIKNYFQVLASVQKLLLSLPGKCSKMIFNPWPLSRNDWGLREVFKNNFKGPVESSKIIFKLRPMFKNIF